MYATKNNNQFITVLGKKYNEKFFTNVDKGLGCELDKTGILLLSNFVSELVLQQLKKEAAALKPRAYRSVSNYNVYVLPDDPQMTSAAPRNRKFKTTKGCVADDEIPVNSILRIIYDAEIFRSFICTLQGITGLFPYGDKLSSININYYDPGDSLEWHFDNADFAITFLVKKCEEGGVYEYVPNMRYDENGKENYPLLEKILDGQVQPKRTIMQEGDLMIFRGNRSLHRVTKIEKGERILVTLNYNMKPGIPLSEKSRMTFFGRI